MKVQSPALPITQLLLRWYPAPSPVKGWAFSFPTCLLSCTPWYLCISETTVTFAVVDIRQGPRCPLQLLHCNDQQREVSWWGPVAGTGRQGSRSPPDCMERGRKAGERLQGCKGLCWGCGQGGDTQRLLQVCNAQSLYVVMCTVQSLEPFSLRIYRQSSSSLTHWNGWTALDETFNN